MKSLTIPENKKEIAELLSYKRNFYLLLSIGSVTLELITLFLGVIFIYITNMANYMTNINNFKFWKLINEYCRQFDSMLLGYIAFGLSIISIVCSSANIRKKFFQLQECLSRFKDGSPDNIRDVALSRAMKLLTPVDHGRFKLKSEKAIRKKRSNFISEVDPLTRRQVLRENIIFCGFIIMPFAFIITLINNISVPIMLMIQIILLYILIMWEYISYKFIMKKSSVNIFSENHRSLITRKSNRRESAIAIKKILAMRKDRYNNYQKTIFIVTNIANFFALVLTLLDISGNEPLKHRFRLPDSKINCYISFTLSIFSIVLYIISLVISNFLDRKIDKIDDYINLNSNTKSYFDILKNFAGSINMKSIFLGKRLDISRGLHEYNVEVLNLNYNAHFQISEQENRMRKHIADEHTIKIALRDVFRVEHRIANNIPRINLTVFVFGAVMFCAFIWEHLTCLNILLLFIGMIVLFFILYFSVKKYVSYMDKNWDLFIKELEHD